MRRRICFIDVFPSPSFYDCGQVGPGELRKEDLRIINDYLKNLNPFAC